eukprot:740304-Amphidinium_carterae.1
MTPYCATPYLPCGSSTKCLERNPMPHCPCETIKSARPTCTMKRKIQQCSINDEYHGSQDRQEDPLCVRRTCRPQGARDNEDKKASLSEHALIFDMVAELAIWQANLAMWFA